MTFSTLVICILIAALVIAVSLYMLRKKDPAEADKIDGKVESGAKATGSLLSRLWSKLPWNK